MVEVFRLISLFAAGLLIIAATAEFIGWLVDFIKRRRADDERV